MNHKMQKIVSLCKRRGFIFPGSEIYNGLANTWDWGPLGIEMVNNIKQLWWQRFVREREDIIGIGSGILMNSKVWQASGHLKEFTDPLIECKKCNIRVREDHMPGMAHEYNMDPFFDCPKGGKHEFTEARQFNLMFKTFISPLEDKTSTVYLRPETAQGMFVNFRNVQSTMRAKLPFGIAQIGKAFRNEITPGNFIFRVLEFEQMEIEYFIKEKNWEKWFAHWQDQMQKWLLDIGINKKNFKIREHGKDELSHYSKKTIDFEYKYPFGRKELYGLAYRTDFDLKAHQKTSGQNLEYQDPKTGKKFIPHVIEPTFGVERTILALLCDGYKEVEARSGKNDKSEKEVILHLDPKIAPIKAAVLPLVKNKKEITKTARDIHTILKNNFMIQYDETGSIGKRYRRQDEVGTPFCITIDFDSLKDNTVTMRDRDTLKQKRIKIKEIKDYLTEKIFSF